MTAPTVPLPQFQQPTPPPVDPYRPEDDPGAPASPDPTPAPAEAAAGAATGRRRRLPGLPNLRRETADGDTRTGISSPGDDDAAPARLLTQAETTRLVIGLLGLAAAGAAWAVQTRDKRRKLRRPTPEQARDIAKPVGRLMLRAAKAAGVALNPILSDAIEAMSATGAYVTDGPLVTLDGVDAGVPSNLQEDPAS
jgi:hypothetical protein